eukprot:scaffold2363_cov159-Amphora_coffeaeformis.AAC.6
MEQTASCVLHPENLLYVPDIEGMGSKPLPRATDVGQDLRIIRGSEATKKPSEKTRRPFLFARAGSEDYPFSPIRLFFEN